MREWKAKTPVSVYICASKHATVVGVIWGTTVDVRWNAVPGRSQRSPTWEAHAQKGWLIYQCISRRTRRGLVPEWFSLTMHGVHAVSERPKH